MSRPNPRRASVALLLALPLALAACGGSSDSGSSAASSGAATSSGSGGGGYQPPGASGGSTTASGGGGGTASELKLAADASGQLAFDTTKLRAKAGTVQITMTNPSSSGVPHAIAIEGNGVDKDGQTAGPGGTSTVKVDLKPGTYTFYCPVDGHEEAGMKGTLTVT